MPVIADDEAAAADTDAAGALVLGVVGREGNGLVCGDVGVGEVLRDSVVVRPCQFERRCRDDRVAESPERWAEVTPQRRDDCGGVAASRTGYSLGEDSVGVGVVRAGAQELLEAAEGRRKWPKSASAMRTARSPRRSTRASSSLHCSRTASCMHRNSGSPSTSWLPPSRPTRPNRNTRVRVVLRPRARRWRPVLPNEDPGDRYLDPLPRSDRRWVDDARHDSTVMAPEACPIADRLSRRRVGRHCEPWLVRSGWACRDQGAGKVTATCMTSKQCASRNPAVTHPSPPPAQPGAPAVADEEQLLVTR